jgi:hypothetical protein
MRVFKEASET